MGINLQTIDRLSITLLMDNFTDRLLPSSAIAKRPPMVQNERFLPAPLAEHGFSAFLEIRYDNDEDDGGGKKKNSHYYLFDAGVSKNGMIYNADLFGINLGVVDAIILSHGHFDHFTGLASMLDRISRPVRIIAHPDAFLKRWLIFPDGTRAMMPVLDEEELKKRGAIIEKNEKTTLLPSFSSSSSSSLPPAVDNNDNTSPRLLVTGEIPRQTSYEKGFPLQYAETSGGSLVHDPLVKDDQALVANIKDKGLVVISGCGHAGIINTLYHAKKLTGSDKIHAVIGGFHLTGAIYEDAIEPTVKELQDINPDYIVPCHCTGWKAVNKIIQLMPDKFVQPSVGTTLNFYT